MSSSTQQCFAEGTGGSAGDYGGDEVRGPASLERLSAHRLRSGYVSGTQVGLSGRHVTPAVANQGFRVVSHWNRK